MPAGGPAARWPRRRMSWPGTSDASFFAWHSPLRCEAHGGSAGWGIGGRVDLLRRRLAGLYHRRRRAVNGTAPSPCPLPQWGRGISEARRDYSHPSTLKGERGSGTRPFSSLYLKGGEGSAKRQFSSLSPIGGEGRVRGRAFADNSG